MEDTKYVYDVLDSGRRRCENRRLMAWYAYILRCADGRNYYGSTCGGISPGITTASLAGRRRDALSRWCTTKSARRPRRLGKESGHGRTGGHVANGWIR